MLSQNQLTLAVSLVGDGAKPKQGECFANHSREYCSKLLEGFSSTDTFPYPRLVLYPFQVVEVIADREPKLIVIFCRNSCEAFNWL